MVACPNCAARFASSRDIEREWMEKHLKRSHGDDRTIRFGDSRFERRREPPPARRAS